LATEFYQYVLLEHKVGERAREYLRARGIHKASIEAFSIGYAPESWQALEQFLVGKKKFTREEMVASGMSVKAVSGRTYDRFRGRVMFPQNNMQGVTVGFSGRVLNPETKEATSALRLHSGQAGSVQAKYVNTPETTIYHKGEILFGLSLAKKAIREKDRAIVVEGELDVISSYQVGVREVVAVKGSALTEGQLQLIRRLTQTAYLALDADSAGQEAIRRAISLAEPSGMNLRVVQLLGGKDPDAVAQADREAWKRMVKEAVSVYQFYIDLACQTYDPTAGTGQKQITQMVIPQLLLIENGVEQAYYVKVLAERLGVRTSVVEGEMARVRSGMDGRVGKGKRKDEAEAPTAMSRRERLERLVVRLLLHLEEHIGVHLNDLEPEWFAEGYLRRTVSGLKRQRAMGEMPVKELVALLPESEQSLLHSLYAEKQDLFEDSLTDLEEQYTEAVTVLRRMNLELRLKQMVGEMSALEGDAEALDRLRVEYSQTRATLKALGGE
jgi:DNA primase